MPPPSSISSAGDAQTAATRWPTRTSSAGRSITAAYGTIPQMADADEVWKQITRNADVRYSALVPNLRGAQRAIDAGFGEIEVVVSASDTHNRKNINRSTDESLDDIAELVEQGARRGLDRAGDRFDRVGVPVRGRRTDRSRRRRGEPGDP